MYQLSFVYNLNALFFLHLSPSIVRFVQKNGFKIVYFYFNYLFAFYQ